MHFFGYKDFFFLSDRYGLIHKLDTEPLTVCEVPGLAVRCRGKDQRCCFVSGSEGRSERTYTET